MSEEKADGNSQAIWRSGSEEVLVIPSFPFEPLPSLDSEALREVEACALEANQRYLIDMVEEHSFCPFSRGGRAQEQTVRFVHFCDDENVEAVIDLMHKVAAQPQWAVAQIIFPIVECDPQEWIDFCQKITKVGNQRLVQESEVFAVAALHPGLLYKETTAFTLTQLFRRAPDPTIQWVRLDALNALYEGRTGDTVVVDALDLMTFMEQKHTPPLYDRIAETNMRMARRLGVKNVERSLSEIHLSARKRYNRILLGGKGEGKAASCASRRAKGCAPCTRSETKVPPLKAMLDGENWMLARLRDLGMREPRHVLAGDVDLVVVRSAHSVDVLYGRCPHRMALLSEAILDETRLVCRAHGWDFELKSGESAGVPGESIHRFSCWTEDGKVYIKDQEVGEWRRSSPQAFILGEL